MAAFDLVVIGDTNLDLLVKVSRFPSEDDEVEAQDVRSLPGGDAANTASQAASLGLHTALISCVGDDENGKRLLRSLQLRGVDTSAVQTSRSRSTGMVIATVREDGQRTMIASRGANSDLALGEPQRTLLNSGAGCACLRPAPAGVESPARPGRDAPKGTFARPRQHQRLHGSERPCPCVEPLPLCLSQPKRTPASDKPLGPGRSRAKGPCVWTRSGVSQMRRGWMPDFYKITRPFCARFRRPECGCHRRW